MHEPDDHDLLRQYAEQNSEAAFAALVARHVDKVYSTALRHTRNVHAAEEITQAVFVILAKKSGRLGAKVILAGWLYETARLTAVTYIRSEIRRARREQEAHMNTALNETADDAWPHIAPLLDDAMSKLNEADRHAIVLRYFDGKSLGEVGAALGASEDAAKKRVTRAVEKLRGWFTKRGVTLTATVLTAAISANSVQAAPLGLAATVTAAAAKGAVATASTLVLVKGASNVMVWTKTKTVLWFSTALCFLGGMGYWIDKCLDTRDGFEHAPSTVMLRPSQYSEIIGKQQSEETSGKLAGRHVPVDLMIANAYGFTIPRIVFPPNFDTNYFDYLVTDTNGGLGKFQSEIEKAIGCKITRQILPVDSLLLVTNKTSLAKLASNRQRYLNWKMDDWKHSTKYDAIGLRTQIEYIFVKPVLDETGLPNEVGIVLDWQPSTSTNWPYADRQPLKTALLDQLGLELVSTNMPIEMLVVEKVK